MISLKGKKIFKSFGEYVLAVKKASEGKGTDPRLIIRKRKKEYFTEEELQKLEKWGDKLLKKTERR